jgi:hypothetical protein
MQWKRLENISREELNALVLSGRLKSKTVIFTRLYNQREQLLAHIGPKSLKALQDVACERLNEQNKEITLSCHERTEGWAGESQDSSSISPDADPDKESRRTLLAHYNEWQSEHCHKSKEEKDDGIQV